MTEGRKDGRTEGRTKQTLNAPLPFYGGGIKKTMKFTSYDIYFSSLMFSIFIKCTFHL